MVERIKSLISHLGLSTRGFALNCGIRQNTLSNQLNGVRELSLSTITAILSAYPNVSSEWIMRGEGEMFKVEAINAKSETIALLNERIKELENQLKYK